MGPYSNNPQEKRGSGDFQRRQDGERWKILVWNFNKFNLDRTGFVMFPECSRVYIRIGNLVVVWYRDNCLRGIGLDKHAALIGE